MRADIERNDVWAVTDQPMSGTKKGEKAVKILNFGSLNQDYVYRVPHIVVEGETISSFSLDVRPGGKGLNQSVALRKAGAEVYHAGMIGEDGLGLKKLCSDLGINTDFIMTGSVRTGNALIQVDDSGKNSIVLYPGANSEITERMADHVLSHFGPEDLIILQNEVSNIAYIIERAYEKGMKVVLNPSPYNAIIEQCSLDHVSLLILNEVEGEQITGMHTPEEMIEKILGRYPDLEVVLTLGEQGAWYAKCESRVYQPAIKTTAKDTTGAGDTFTGYFVYNYMGKGLDCRESLKISAAAAAIAVGKEGAAPSIPFYEDVIKFLKE